MPTALLNRHYTLNTKVHLWIAAPMVGWLSLIHVFWPRFPMRLLISRGLGARSYSYSRLFRVLRSSIQSMKDLSSSSCLSTPINRIQSRFTPNPRLNISGSLPMTQPNQRAGNNWWSPMKVTPSPFMFAMVRITWTWSHLLMMIWNGTHKFSSLPTVLGTQTPSMRNSCLMHLTPLWTFPGSKSDVINVQRLICSRFPPRLPLHHSTNRLLKPDSPLLCIPYPICLKCFVVAFLTLMLSCLISAG